MSARWGESLAVGSGRSYIFEMGASSFKHRLDENSEAVPYDSEIAAVWSLVQKYGPEDVINAAFPRHRDAARTLVEFSSVVKGEI